MLIPAADFQVILDGVGGDKLSVFVSETGETCGACALAFEGEGSVSVTVYKEEQALPIDVAQFANIVIAKLRQNRHIRCFETRKRIKAPVSVCAGNAVRL